MHWRWPRFYCYCFDGPRNILLCYSLLLSSSHMHFCWYHAYQCIAEGGSLLSNTNSLSEYPITFQMYLPRPQGPFSCLLRHYVQATRISSLLMFPRPRQQWFWVRQRLTPLPLNIFGFKMGKAKLVRLYYQLCHTVSTYELTAICQGIYATAFPVGSSSELDSLMKELLPQVQKAPWFWTRLHAQISFHITTL